jgi:hypothetical protein
MKNYLLWTEEQQVNFIKEKIEQYFQIEFNSIKAVCGRKHYDTEKFAIYVLLRILTDKGIGMKIAARYTGLAPQTVYEIKKRKAHINRATNKALKMFIKYLNNEI